MKPAPVLRYPGAKWMIAPWIVSCLPRHTTFVEPFFGSGAVFFTKGPSKSEYINDLDGDVVNLFRVCRESPGELATLLELTPWAREEYTLAFEPTADPVERARRTLVQHWQSFGGTVHKRKYRSGWRHNGATKGVSTTVTRQWDRLPARVLATVRRLREAQIECLPAIELLGRLNAPDVLAYVDPPYVGRVRDWKHMYREEMLADAAHVHLLEFLLEFRGAVVLSGYPCDLYDDLLADWTRLTRRATAEKGGTREEVLWINPRGVACMPHHHLFGGER